jgi:hypothetical protein
MSSSADPADMPTALSKYRRSTADCSGGGVSLGTLRRWVVSLHKFTLKDRAHATVVYQRNSIYCLRLPAPTQVCIIGLHAGAESENAKEMAKKDGLLPVMVHGEDAALADPAVVAAFRLQAWRDAFRADLEGRSVVIWPASTVH